MSNRILIILFVTCCLPYLVVGYTVCGEGQEWTDCGSNCLPTCEDPYPLCNMGCVRDICECPNSKPLMHNGQCITLQDCPQEKPLKLKPKGKKGKNKDKDEDQGDNKLSKKQAKKCAKDEKTLIKCHDNEIYNVNLTEFNVDANILNKFLSSKTYKGILAEAVTVSTNSFIGIFLESEPYFLQDSDTDLRGAAEYIPVRDYMTFKNELMEQTQLIFTKAINGYLDSETFLNESQAYIDDYITSEEGIKFIDEKVEAWYAPLSKLHEKIKRNNINTQKKNAIKFGEILMKLVTEANYIEALEAAIETSPPRPPTITPPFWNTDTTTDYRQPLILNRDDLKTISPPT